MFAEAIAQKPATESQGSPAPHATEGVLFVARLGPEERPKFERACLRAGHRAIVIGAPSVCREILEAEAVAPASLFVDVKVPGAPELIAWVRGAPRWRSLSIVALVQHPTESAYVEAHRIGVDDVTLRTDVGALTRRLAAVSSDDEIHADPTQGRALVAHPDGQRRRVVGRTLHQAGFEVAFASDAAELSKRMAEHPDATLLAIAESIVAGDPDLVTRLRSNATQPDLPTVILDVDTDTEHAGGTSGRLGVVADAAAPDNLLFVVNELGAQLGGDLRATPRLLYSTLCAFRRAHDVSPEFGLTYNISRDGLYVRTVDPPPVSTSVWLELRPPGTTQIVHLRGQVVWVQRAANGARATVPPGFGVRLLDPECPPVDLERYRGAYQAFREEPRPYVVAQPVRKGSAPPGSDRARLLVVDDDERTLRVYRRILEASYEIVTAHDGQDAITKFERTRFDAVLCDIGMPGIGGLDVLKRIHELRPHVPVVMATGAPTVDSAIRAIEHGAFRYLTKPFDAETLKGTIERAIQLGRLARLKQDALHVHADATGRRSGPELRRSFERALDHLYMAYQPIVAWRAQEVLAYEALVRSTETSLPHPGALFQAAEALGELGTLSRAIRALAPTPFEDRNERLFLNLHAHDLMDDDLFSASTSLAAMAHRVTLEITERASLEGISGIPRRIADLRAMGFTIAIDDIGAGYAGLTSFAQLEPDVAKLDMSLIRDVHRVPTKQRLIRSFREICDDLGIVLVCEGVETREERDCMLELGCDVFQGYLFGRPDRELKGAMVDV